MTTKAQTTMRQLIEDKNASIRKLGNMGGWQERHYAGWTNPSVPGAAVVLVIRALAKYADAHRARYETPIGEDYVLGEYWSQIAKGALGLLNGELGGGLDAGTLDGMIRDMMAASGVDPDTGDLGYTPKEG